MRTKAIVALLLFFPFPALAEAWISLTFDDTHRSQHGAAELLSSYGMKGTFYVNSRRVGQEGFMTLAELQGMEKEGHEIGGHTLSHLPLAQLPYETQLREICDDRATLLSMGLSPRAFAYPFNSHSDATKLAVEECGYNSARGTSGLRNPAGCEGCPIAEFLPPDDEFSIRAFPSFQDWMDIGMLEDAVYQTIVRGNGWLVLVFHDICRDSCSPYGIDSDRFESFISWLSTQDLQVATVSELIPGDLHPPISGPPLELPDREGSNLLRNPSLELDADGDGLSDCWTKGGFGTNRGRLARIADAGEISQLLTVTSLQSGDLKFLSERGACAPRASPGKRYSISLRHRTKGEARMVAYYQDGGGEWVWWSQGPLLSNSNQLDWSHWNTPPIPDAAMYLQVGVSLRSVGEVEIDHFYLEPTDPDLPSSSSCSGRFPLPLALLPFLRRFFSRR